MQHTATYMANHLYLFTILTQKREIAIAVVVVVAVVAVGFWLIRRRGSRA